MARLIGAGPLLILTLLLAAVLVGVAPVHAEVIVFTAQLLAANEVPPVVVSGSEANAIGSAIITLSVVRSGTSIVSTTARFDVAMSGLPGGDTIILAHIHQGVAGVNGPVVVDSGITPGSPISVGTSGSVTFTRDGISVPTGTAQAIIDNLVPVPLDPPAGTSAGPSAFYFNVHTTPSPNGVARGQLAFVGSGTASTVPVLSAWGTVVVALLLTATAFFFLSRRKLEPESRR
jgi:hypothetical protein